FFLIPCWDNNRNPRMPTESHGIAVRFRTGNIGNVGHAESGVNNARKPSKSKNRARDPVKVMHPALGLPCLDWGARSDMYLRRKLHPVEQYGRRDDHG